MILNDRTADPEPHPHSLRLGRVERLKEPRVVTAAEADARITHLDHDRWLAIQFFVAGLDPQSPLSIRGRHCFNAVFNQVQHDLLQLNRVAEDGRKGGGQVRSFCEVINATPRLSWSTSRECRACIGRTYRTRRGRGAEQAPCA